MAMDPDRLKALVLPQTEQHYDARDTMFHALSVGFSPDDARELDFVYERALKAAPSLALTLCFRSLSTMDIGVDYRKVVHAAQALHLHAALPASATVLCKTRIAEVWDLGAAKGALLELDRELHDKASGVLLATTRMSALCRGDGGFGGDAPPARAAWEVTGKADHVFIWQTMSGQAAFYRLQGDMNPLHIDPERARAVGFERPILHGLATFAGCVRAILATALGHEPARLRSVQGRFSAPFFPGEALQVEIWDTGAGTLAFQARSRERDLLVIRDGVAHAHR
ncbi:3-alpha,7-alpha,12-alpha-trihydroxy-5-beta-cholest-24-enoyl-CoA hydratase [Verticiella sediminum]|uniref:3-alpha,7-alpha, 12-alpha-trihydroxy-5-beta-cholest-24-enoyl-CoA hydratase n=1 Tax=Verticiella sediminum TaxID=1247510 RepID=A0A556B0D9_9BURK|nr:MaoC/PaaZ C-terminal domain-containing protein [Verticiella sediminum]TSH98630.1 3-alpha,7-alpha,12-alpha-trihydroxy-5-beta-cholest-24-enoyl-CoA hydratase [Verticiella sediminum]